MTNLTDLLFNRGIADAMPLFLAQYSSSSSSSRSAESAAASAMGGLLGLIIVLVLYVVIAFCMYTFLKKLDYENPWMAWVPFASTYAILEAGEQDDPLIWTIVSACGVIPYIGIIASLVALVKIIPAWITICNRLGKSPYILLTYFLCCTGVFIVPVVLAFT
jgi:hypothetical protein